MTQIEHTERLIRLSLKDGSFIDFHRDDDNTVRVCREDFCVPIPNCTGALAIQLFALLETQGTILDELDEENKNEL